MSRPSFLEGAGVALATSAVAAVVFTALTGIVPIGTVARVVVAGVGLAYLVYLLARSPGRAGRVSALGLWALATGACVVLEAPLTAVVLVQAGVVWLVRSLYFQASVLGALADGALVALGLAAALWAAIASASVFLTVWCALLVQALFVAVPRAARRGAPRSGAGERFEQAARSAESAVRRLSTAA